MHASGQPEEQSEGHSRRKVGVRHVSRAAQETKDILRRFTANNARCFERDCPSGINTLRYRRVLSLRNSIFQHTPYSSLLNLELDWVQTYRVRLTPVEHRVGNTALRGSVTDKPSSQALDLPWCSYLETPFRTFNTTFTVSDLVPSIYSPAAASPTRGR